MRRLSDPAKNAEIDHAVAEYVGLSAEQRELLSANQRQTELAYRVAWARSGLSAIGAIESAGRALWRVTEDGRGMDCDDVERRHQCMTNGGNPGGPPEWKEIVLKRLRSIRPDTFERLSASLLRAAGFDEVEVTGRSGDGGIDGVGVYRPTGLISFHTAFQCKRYQGSVGAGAVRDFRGSFIGRADRGIIITTGTFTRDAKSEASRPGANPVDLVDGEQLCDLLMEHRLGVRVTQRMVEDVTIDTAYFDRLEAPR